MGIGSDPIAAVFFLRREDFWTDEPIAVTRLPVEQLARRAGVRSMRYDHVAGHQYLVGMWSHLSVQDVEIEEREFHRTLWIRFMYGDWMSFWPEPGSGEGRTREQIDIAYQFRDACEALKPEAAVFIAYNHDANARFVTERELDVMSFSANALFGANCEMTYIVDYIADTDAPYTYFIECGRKLMPLSSGLLMLDEAYPELPPERPTS